MNRLLSPKLYAITDDLLAHWCTACDGFHLVFINRPNHFLQRWDWNNDPIRPTFNPTLGTPNHCHYRITDGMVHYLPDCKHLLSDLQVALPDIPTYLHEKLSLDYFINRLRH